MSLQFGQTESAVPIKKEYCYERVFGSGSRIGGVCVQVGPSRKMRGSIEAALNQEVVDFEEVGPQNSKVGS